MTTDLRLRAQARAGMFDQRKGHAADSRLIWDLLAIIDRYEAALQEISGAEWSWGGTSAARCARKALSAKGDSTPADTREESSLGEEFLQKVRSEVATKCKDQPSATPSSPKSIPSAQRAVLIRDRDLFAKLEREHPGFTVTKVVAALRRGE